MSGSPGLLDRLVVIVGPGNAIADAEDKAALRYGVMRDPVIGLEVVLADGRVLDLMRAVKRKLDPRDPFNPGKLFRPSA